MATRNVTMVVDRQHYEDFTERMMDITPSTMAEYSKVNMYLHHDGYPEWQGVQLANWVLANQYQDSTRVAAKLVHDMYYDSCFLYSEPDQIDHQYTYVIWTGDRGDMWISCYDQYMSKCVFVLSPDKVIKRFSDNMEYTDFANGKTRIAD